MSQWPMVKLGDVCTVAGGGTPKTAVSEYWGGPIPWLTPKDLSGNRNLYISHGERSITQSGLANSSATLLPKGTVLWSSRAPIGHVAIAETTVATNQGFKSFIPGPNVDSAYLAYILIFMKDQLQEIGTGATFKEVSAKRAKSIQIPLPPFEEQRRIAQVLTQTSLNISNTKQQIDLLDTICRTPIFANPSRPSTELKEYIRTISTGKSVKDTSDPDSGNKILKISAVTSGFFKGNETKYLPVEYSPKESHAVAYGDLLVSRANTSEMIGASALVDQDESNVYLPDKLWKIFPVGDVPKEAIWHLLQLPTIRKRMSQVATGSSGSMKNISQRSFLKVEVPNLTLSEISSITEVVKRILSTRKLLLKKLTLLEELHQSLATRAFAGQL